MSTSEYKLLETFVLKVHMNCQGCTNKVRKALKKVEGVYKVEIDAEEQKVTVTGSVNPSTLVKKLAKFGKHAEIWNAGYNQEQVNHVEEYENNQVQHIINDHNAYENQYMIPTFGRDQWGHEWCLNNLIGARDAQSEINQHLAEPLLLENVNNINNHSFTRINDNPVWEESMITTMNPASFQENNVTYYSHLGSQKLPWNLLQVSPSSEYSYQPFPIANMLEYYNNYHPSKAMQLYHYNNLP